MRCEVGGAAAEHTAAAAVRVKERIGLNGLCLRGAGGVAGEKERVVGRGWVREAAARGDIMIGTGQLQHSFERHLPACFFVRIIGDNTRRPG